MLSVVLFFLLPSSIIKEILKCYTAPEVDVLKSDFVYLCINSSYFHFHILYFHIFFSLHKESNAILNV